MTEKNKPEWVWVEYHDDPPCHDRLNEDGDCQRCGCHPDMQSKALVAHCPADDTRLVNGSCPVCWRDYQRPQVQSVTGVS